MDSDTTPLFGWLFEAVGKITNAVKKAGGPSLRAVYLFLQVYYHTSKISCNPFIITQLERTEDCNFRLLKLAVLNMPLKLLSARKIKFFINASLLFNEI